MTRLPAEKPGNGGSTPNTARGFSLSRRVLLALGVTGVQWVMGSLFLSVMGAEGKADFTPPRPHTPSWRAQGLHFSWLNGLHSYILV